MIEACATDQTKLLVKSVCVTAPKSLSWTPHVYQDVSTRHDWSVKKTFAHRPFYSCALSTLAFE